MLAVPLGNLAANAILPGNKGEVVSRIRKGGMKKEKLKRKESNYLHKKGVYETK